MISTAPRRPVAFYRGSDYAPNQIGSWVAADERDFPWNTIGRALNGHGEGTKVNHLMTAAEVLDATGMDLTFEKYPVCDATSGAMIPKLFCTGYDDPTTGERHYIAGVSDRYELAQPAEALGVFDSVLEIVDGSYYTAAWNMREKAMMGVTIALPQEIVVDPDGANDRTSLHLLGINSFDGSTGLVGQLQTTRWFCMNQLAPAMRHAKRSFCLRHTRNWKNRSAGMAEALGITTRYAEELDKAANALYQTKMTTAQFERWMKRLAPFHIDNDAKPVVRDRVLERRAEALAAWNAPHNENIVYTRWGALNVVAEFAQWGRNVKGSPRTGTDPVRQRAIGTLVSPHVTGLVTQAYEMLAA